MGFDFCASGISTTLVFVGRLHLIADLGIFKDELPSITEAYGDFTLCLSVLLLSLNRFRSLAVHLYLQLGLRLSLNVALV